uniref:Cyclin-dependent protein kinase inhibitor SMR6-like n=1 Tax=Ananas comosus var. bracteatus TaxID=296719 RepID=A0A6V7Q630_ANACO|nr:unnamed protein product [Ananas comosus var. bracteatus]
MGFQKKQHQSEANGEKTMWVIAGIPLKAPILKPLKPLTTAPQHEAKEEEEEEGLLLQLTPKKGAKVLQQQQEQEVLLCPPAPKKARPPLRCRVEGVEFFDVPEDLASVFMERRRS